MDKEIFEKYAFIQDVISHKDNITESDFSKDISDLDMMLNDMNNMLQDEHVMLTMGVEGVMSYFMLIQKFSKDLKPIYIRALLAKEAMKNNE